MLEIPPYIKGEESGEMAQQCIRELAALGDQGLIPSTYAMAPKHL